MSDGLLDLFKDARRRVIGNKALRDEDALRVLAVNDRKGFRLPIIYGNDEFLLTSHAAWTGALVPNKPWGFMDESARRQYYYAALAIWDRMFPSGKENAGHLMVTNQVYSADDWQNNLLERHADTASKAFAEYVRASRDVVEQKEFFERECYLFTRLGARGTHTGWRGYMRDIIDFFTTGAGLDDSQPDEEEIDFWSQQANAVIDTLSTSWLTSQVTHRIRLEWLTRHLDTPGLPTPNIAPAHEQHWGQGQWRTVLSSYTQEVDLGVVNKNRLRCVKFDAPVGDGTAYAAYLPVNHIPDDAHYSTNWMHHASSLPFPVDISCHFEVIEPERAEKDLERSIFAAEAQETEDHEAGIKPDETQMMQQRGLRQVRSKVMMQRQPLVMWQTVFCVYDTDIDALRKKVTRLIRHYNEIQFELVCPRNDQRELFYQSFPGAEILVEDWMHRTDAAYPASAMPWLTSSVGDRGEVQGLYQGHTVVTDSNGVAQKGVPVFYDLQNVVEEEGRAPTEVVAGFPGSGKRLDLDTTVPTVDGFKPVRDLRIGDRLFDEHGQVCTLTALHPVEEHADTYRITFDDGTTVLADAEHRWTTETRASRLSARNSQRSRARTPKGSQEFRDYLKHLIQVTDPESTTTPTLLQAEIDAMVNPGRVLTRKGLRGVGTPGRDVYLRLSKALTQNGSYVQSNRNGGGRRYPLYSTVEFAKSLLTWAEETSDDQQNKRVLPQTRTTAQIAATLHADGGRPNHSIPVSDPAQYPARDLPVDPYLLGAWLGDGRSNGTGAFTTKDPEIIDAFTDAGFSTQLATDKGTCQEFYISGLKTALRPLGVIDNKHIPDNYLLGSVEQRLALLQGLMDTDGSVDQQGHCEFYASDKALAHQVRSLAASLGMKATLRSKQGGYVGIDGTRHDCKTAYTVAFTPNQKVTRLHRKVERLTLSDRRSTAERRYIVNAEPIAPTPMRCVTVDSPSHLFLVTDQYVPTHNTVSRGLKIAHEDGLRGVTQMIWDPKGDFLPLVKYAQKMRLNPDKVHLIDLYDPNNSISLDAYATAEVDRKKKKDERDTAAVDTLSALCRDYVKEGTRYRRVITTAVKHEMNYARANGVDPTMQSTLNRMRAWGEGDTKGLEGVRDEDTWVECSQALFEHLEAISHDTLGQLLFRPTDSDTSAMTVDPGSMTIFVAINMQPTQPGEEPTRRSTVADVISGLMTDYIRSLLYRLPDDAPKSLMFDEWHVIKRTSRAEALVDWLKRMGRSKNTQCRQMSQSATDFTQGSLSTVWCGYAQNDEEAEASCQLLGIEASETNTRLLRNLTAGEFLFRDMFGRVARVKVDIWDDWLLRRFNTSPKAKETLVRELTTTDEDDTDADENDDTLITAAHEQE